MRTTTAYSNPEASSFKAQRLPHAVAVRAAVAVLLEALPPVERPVEWLAE